MKRVFAPLYSFRFSLMLYALYILLGITVLIATEKPALHLFFNQHHHALTDLFFRYVTHLGDGAVAFVLLPFVLWRYRLRVFALAASTCIFAGVLAQLLKRTVFKGAPRPAAFFEEGALRTIEGVTMHFHNSFPSGHTTFGVAVCCLCGFLAQTRGGQIGFFVAAVLIGFSRVYLSQHFFEDVVAGTGLGVVSFLLAAVCVCLVPEHILPHKAIFGKQGKSKLANSPEI